MIITGSNPIELSISKDKINAQILGTQIIHTFEAIPVLMDYIGKGCIVQGFIEDGVLVIEKKLKEVHHECERII